MCWSADGKRGKPRPPMESASRLVEPRGEVSTAWEATQMAFPLGASSRDPCHGESRRAAEFPLIETDPHNALVLFALLNLLLQDDPFARRRFGRSHRVRIDILFCTLCFVLVLVDGPPSSAEWQTLCWIHSGPCFFSAATTPSLPWHENVAT